MEIGTIKPNEMEIIEQQEEQIYNPKKDPYKNFDKFVLKSTPDVIVYYALHDLLIKKLQLINQGIKQERPYDKMIICGGEAVNVYLTDFIETHDFDIKYVCHDCLNDSFFYNTQYKIMEFLCNEVNKYLYSTDPSDFYLPYIKNLISGPAYVGNHKGENISIFNYGFEFMALIIPYFDGNTESVLDLKLFSRHNTPHYECWIGKSGMTPCFPELKPSQAEVTFTQNQDDPIPNITYNGLEYATLGYVIWDTFRMVIISNTTEKKLDKYRYKLLRLLNGLNDKNLNTHLIDYVNKMPHVGGSSDDLYKCQIYDNKCQKYKNKYLESKINSLCSKS